jgi:hypothetical protein
MAVIFAVLAKRASVKIRQGKIRDKGSLTLIERDEQTRRPKIPYPRGKPTEYYGNFSFGSAYLTKVVAASCGEFNPKRD